MSALRKEIELFANDMERRLRENDHKGGWEDCSIQYLICRAVEELGELAALLQNENDYDEMEVTEEAADVANFCMMIADVVSKPPAAPAEQGEGT